MQRPRLSYDAQLNRQRPATVKSAAASLQIINKQEPLHQIWVATRENGYHFDWKDGQWIENRGGRELMALLSDACSKQSGETVTLG